MTIKDKPGHYTVKAAFAGDVAYDGVSSQEPFTVIPIPTTVTYTGPVTGVYNAAVTLSAKLTETEPGTALAGQKLTFTLGKESCKAETESSGIASCSITPLDAAGKYSLEVKFAGNTTYEASTRVVSFEVQKAPTTLTYTGPTSAIYNTSVKLSAKLTETKSGSPLAAQKLTFTLGKESCEGETESSGIASCSITPLDAAGKYSLEVKFAGSSIYEASAKLVSFEIQKEATALVAYAQFVYNPPLGGIGPFYVAAKLTAAGAPVQGRTITFSIATKSLCGAVTESSGIATCKLTSSQETSLLQAKRYLATFAGDAFYLPSVGETPVYTF